KIAGSDADDRVEVVVEAELAADRGTLPSEMPSPETVADDGHLGDAGAVVGIGEEAAGLRLRAEETEVIRVGEQDLRPLGPIESRDVGVDGPDAADLGKGAGLLAVVEELRRGEAGITSACLREVR